MKTTKGCECDVDLISRTCSCRKWDLSGIPCAYKLACIIKRKEDPLMYIYDWHRRHKYLAAHTPNINPILDMQEWLSITHVDSINPHISKKQWGKPKKSRNKKTDEILEVSKKSGKL